jgi:NAD(P)-dependent dehydrogenase (short-subunit alcohol dehydrogenase family)
MGFYSASKHAIEGYAESLDHEVRSLGVRALLIEPGFMKTRIDQSAARAQRQIDDYREARDRVGAGINASVERGDDPQQVAKVAREAAGARRPRLRYPVGKGAATLARLRSFMPSGLFDRSLRKEFHLDE